MSKPYTYKVFDPPHRPFRVGDEVIVLDREGMNLGRQKIVLASGRIAGTECGRIWRQKDGYWIGDENRAWPFPTIHHVEVKP